MKIKFAGTGDGRGLPVVDCQCEQCERTRKEGGKKPVCVAETVSRVYP